MAIQISLQEKLRLMTEQLDRLPAGYGYCMNYWRNRDSEPKVSITIETGFDDFTHVVKSDSYGFTADERDNREFAACYSKVCATVKRLESGSSHTDL